MTEDFLLRNCRQAVRILQQNVKRRMNEQMKFEVINDPAPCYASYEMVIGRSD